MTKLKLGPIPDEKPVKLTLELPAQLHRDLTAYGEILGRETGQEPIEAKKLVVPMLERFIATDREFAKARRSPRVSDAEKHRPRTTVPRSDKNQTKPL